MHNGGTHPAIKRLRNIHSRRVTRLLHLYHSKYTPPEPTLVTWKPKYPNIKWPNMNRETHLSPEEWKLIGFPHHPLPKEIQGQVDTIAWDDRITQLLKSDKVNMGLISVMKEISLQLMSVSRISGLVDRGT